MGKYIDGSGLSHFMGILKGYFVPKTRKVNGYELSADVTITKSDVGLGSTANGAEVNQNAFSNVKVGSTTIAADSKTDTLELVAGSNVTLTPDATNDKVTIAAQDTHWNIAGPYAGTSTGTNSVATDPYIKMYENNTLLGTMVQLKGGTNISVKSDGGGAVTIAATGFVDEADFDLAYAASPSPTLYVTYNGDEQGNGVELPLYSGSTTGLMSPTAMNDLLSPKANLASPTFTGTPKAPTAAAGTNTTQIATTAFVTNAVGTATAGALQYKGTAAKESDISGQAYKKGWYYVVATAGTYFGKVCEVGDMLIAKQDKTSTPANDWDAIQSNIEVLSNAEIDTLWAAA